MPLFPNLQLILKLSDLRDEAARAVALVPKLTAALAEPQVYRKLELIAPSAQEICLILASGLKDLAPDLMFGAAGDESEQDQEDEVRAVCAAQGVDYDGVKDFFAKVRELAKQIYAEVEPYLPYVPWVLPFLGTEDEAKQ